MTDKRKPAGERRPESHSDVPASSETLEPVDAAHATLEEFSDVSAERPDTGQLVVELHQAQDRALRAQAELENFRKRIRREQQEERKLAALPLLRELLPVFDNLRRAINFVGDAPSSGIAEGVKMVADQLTEVLQRHDCYEIDPRGEPFDPMYHEAIDQQPSDEFPPGSVMDVKQTGYRLHDRVIRPAQVIVSSGPAP